jgi:hypothetical protein
MAKPIYFENMSDTCQSGLSQRERIHEPNNFLEGNGWVDEGSMGLDPYCRWVLTLNAL